MRLNPGTVLARRYCLGELLGEGGMGEVWAARHVLTGKAVAVKRLICAAHERGFGEARARFALEARSACAVEHPNVVEVYDFIESDDEGPFIVMELLQGETLAARLARGALGSAREVAELMLPVVSAVGTAHERGIVHRDLKPSNIFISARPGEPTRDKIKVLDFGIAKWFAGSRDERGLSTRTGSALGTPSYMAPEQATAERSADHRVDIWSLGVILYEVTSGVRPLEGENAAQLVMRLLSSGIMPIEQLVPELPEALAALIGRMLSRDVARRPRDLREVYAVLRELATVDSLAFGPPRVADVPARNVGAAGEGPASDQGTRAVDPNAAASAGANPLPPTRRQTPQRSSARDVTPTRTSVDALAVTAQAGVAVTAQAGVAALPSEVVEPALHAPPSTTPAGVASVTPDALRAAALPGVSSPLPGIQARSALVADALQAPVLSGESADEAAPPKLAVTVREAGRESWEEAAQQTHAAFSTDELWVGAEARGRDVARASRRRRLTGLVALLATVVGLAGYAFERTSATPPTEQPQPRTTSLAAQPSPRAMASARDAQTVHEPTRDVTTAASAEARENPEHGPKSAAAASRGSLRAPAMKRRGMKRNSPASANGGAAATSSHDAARTVSAANTLSPSREPSTPLAAAPSATGESAPRKKPKGVECESSPECRSNLCVAYTCQ